MLGLLESRGVYTSPQLLFITPFPTSGSGGSEPHEGGSRAPPVLLGRIRGSAWGFHAGVGLGLWIPQPRKPAGVLIQSPAVQVRLCVH